LRNQFLRLIEYNKEGKAFELTIPTPDHYLPLIYAMGVKENDDEIAIFNDQPVAGAFDDDLF
jgi:4,5-DOPA dioxygenase extradiol